MPLHVRIGTAFRWRPTMESGEASDFLRVVEGDGVRLALLANGYECGFSACWPPASRLILELFIEAWSASSGPVRDRLDAAFEAARRRFLERAPLLVTPDADFPDLVPFAVLLAVAIEGTAVHLAWIGGDVGVLARGFRAILSTTPHTMREHFKREHPEITDASQVPNVLMRTIAGGAGGPPDYLAAHAEAGDTLLLLSRSFTGPGVAIDDAAFAATGHATPTALADRLAGLAFAEADTPPYAAVVAIRFGSADVESM